MTDDSIVRYQDIYKLESLETAWDQIRRKGGLESLVYDVIEFLDYEYNLKRNLSSLSRRLRIRTYKPAAVKDLPTTKNNGLTRPVVTLYLEDVIVSQSIIFQLAKFMDEKLITGVFSVRATKNPKKPFRGWYSDWPKYQNKLKKMLDSDSWVVVSDITGYFDNIDLRILKEQLINLGKSEPQVIDLTMFLLESWMFRQLYGMPIGRGIPQADLDFSQALSNFFLYPHDEQMKKLCGTNYVRWMDDMNFVVDSE